MFKARYQVEMKHPETGEWVLCLRYRSPTAAVCYKEKLTKTFPRDEFRTVEMM